MLKKQIKLNKIKMNHKPLSQNTTTHKRKRMSMIRNMEIAAVRKTRSHRLSLNNHSAVEKSTIQKIKKATVKKILRLLKMKMRGYS